MAHPHLDWYPRSSSALSIANTRVALALVRVFRRVQLPHDEADLVALARCLWPVARLFPDELRQALTSASALRPRTRRSGFVDDADSRAAIIRALGSKRRTLPREPGDEFVLEVLGDALVNHTPAFRVLFDGIEAELEANVSQRRANTDSSIELLSGLLHLEPIETAFLKLCAAVTASSFTGSFFCLARAPLRMFQAVRAALNVRDEHEIRSMLRRTSRLARSGVIDGDSLGARADMEDVLRLSRQAMLILGSRARSVGAMASAVLRKAPRPSDEELAWPRCSSISTRPAGWTNWRRSIAQSPVLRAARSASCKPAAELAKGPRSVAELWEQEAVRGEARMEGAHGRGMVAGGYRMRHGLSHRR
jgi:hypothetical protein